MADHKIKWNGVVDDSESDSLASADNNEVPESVDIVWGGYVPCWYPNNYADCVIADMYYEDFDAVGTAGGNPDGVIDSNELVFWTSKGRTDISNHILTEEMITGGNIPDKAPKTTYTWGDVSFIIEIADGLGTGNRRAREARLHKFDKDTKKRIIHLICRVKGEKVYDEQKEVGDITIKLEDADLVIKEVLGKMRVENTNVL